MNIDLIKELKGKEITVTYKNPITAHLYKWNRYKHPIELDIVIINKLIKLSILEEDSGCFENGEVHFVLDTNNINKIDFNIDSLLNVIRSIKIDKLLRN